MRGGAGNRSRLARRAVGSSAAWIAGVGLGRERRLPTAAEVSVWAAMNLKDAFLRGVREGRTMEPRRVQTELALD